MKSEATLRVWVDESSRSLVVLSTILRCQIPLLGLVMVDHGELGLEMSARMKVSPEDAAHFEKRMRSIVGVIDATMEMSMQETTGVRTVSTAATWMSSTTRTARAR